MHENRKTGKILTTKNCIVFDVFYGSINKDEIFRFAFHNFVYSIKMISASK